jgi:LysM repeat protein
MQSARQFGNALILALVSTGLVLGGLSLSLVEFSRTAPPASTPSLLPSPVPLTATATLPPPVQSATSTSAPSATSTFPPPVACSIPAGWIGIYVQASDTLESLARQYRISSDQLNAGNCLLANNLVPGSVIYVPPVAPNTVAACVPGAVGWVNSYIVQSGDTIFRIAINHYTTASLLKQVNCRTSDQIFGGDKLWVPNVATRTPTPTLKPFEPTFTLFPTDPLTETALPFTVTPSPTTTPPPPPPTITPSATTAPSATPSLTAFPTPTTAAP